MRSFSSLLDMWMRRCFVASSQAKDKCMKVSLIGSGNWGSAFSRIIGSNVKKLDNFDDEVKMFVHDEIVDGKKLSEIINETHYNVKYLPQYELPSNVVAVPDLIESALDADIIVFVVPHQFVKDICSTLAGNIKTSAIGLSLIKGLEIADGGGIELVSRIIKSYLNIEVNVLMGANIAKEIAAENFCEATLGCRDSQVGAILKQLIQTDYFRVVVVDDISTIELCGALKNIVACAAGFVDGLNLGSNTKAAVMRLGFVEIMQFIKIFYPGAKITTYLESCGIADLIATCYGDSRNRRVSIEFVRTEKSLKELEDEMLQGQKLQGVPTAKEVNFMLKSKDKEKEFPLFTAVHNICSGNMKPQMLINAIKVHPAHM